jgi:GTPase SAR1 family protein
MRVLVQAAFKIEGMQFGSDQVSAYAQEFLNIPQKSNAWSREIGERIIALWADPMIKRVYEMAGQTFQLNETANYFFDHCGRFLEDDYVPLEEDILRARVRTTGIEEAKFIFDKNVFEVVDVGGQRSERRKWIHCFSEVTAVLFVASLSDYDNSLREDNMQNRLIEALQLFEEVANSSYFGNSSSLILFLNKTDLFKDKITRVKLSDYFPLFEGGADFEKATLFLRLRFLERVRNGKTVFVHNTCALNKNNIEFVIKSVRQILLNDIVDKNFNLD